jgi:hypothetical protein
MARQQLAIDARAIVKTFEIRGRRKSPKVRETHGVRGPDREVVCRVLRRRRLEPRTSGDVRRHPEDRFQLLRLACLVELDGTEQVATVGQRQRTLSVCVRRCDEFLRATRGRQKAVVGVGAKVNEVGARRRVHAAALLFRSQPRDGGLTHSRTRVTTESTIRSHGRSAVSPGSRLTRRLRRVGSA